MLSVFTSFMSVAVGWSGPYKVTRTSLSRAWDPCSMARVSGRETPSGAVSVAASAREVAAPFPMIT